MIRNAFVGRTDTHATWGLLQMNCLLIKADQEREQRASQESLLARRLREIREAREGTPPPEPSKPAPSPDYRLPTPPKPATPAPSPQAKYPNPPKAPSRYETSAINSSERTVWSSASPTEARPDVIGEAEALPKNLPPRTKGGNRAKSRLVWLSIMGSNRHIALPHTGELVLGRFDPNLGVPPDIDLALEDAGAKVISRRHAKVAGIDGRHTIEDLGSRHGLLLNNQPVTTPHLLQLGDQISLGNLRLVYDLAPVNRQEVVASAHIRHILIVTPTGETLTIAPPQDIVIGRSDRYVNFTPDIDLNPLDEIAVRVSRRHAIITWRDGLPYVEDLGSGFGTRLNGEMLLLGQAVPLRPGDHIWLAGCVLAYDIEL
jgi:pSer/pThr/pTyr-binding forkhead associated (FHA) protein